MKLAKLEITNFRCFESLTVPLHPEVNVFVGMNGSGKTTILDAIAVALYHVVAANGAGGKRQRDNQKATLQPTDIFTRPGDADSAIRRKDFVSLSIRAEQFYPVHGFPLRTSIDEPNSLEWTDHVSYQLPAGFSYASSKSSELISPYQYFKALWDETKRSAPKALIAFPMIAYYRASRRISRMPDLGDVLAQGLDRAAAYRNALDAGTDYQAMCQWLYLTENVELRQMAGQRREEKAGRDDLKAVREALLRMLDGVKRIHFEGTPPKLKADFEQSDGSTQSFEISQLSDGYRNLLAITLDFARRLAQANPGWENPLKAPGVLLIDEIELHLHPGWQQDVLLKLRAAFPNTQVIVTTHSPQVVSTVSRESVQILGQGQGDRTLRAPDFQTRGVESADVLARIMGVDAVPKVPEARWLSEYRAMIETGQNDGPSASSLRGRLIKHFGREHPVILDCDRLIRFQALKRRSPRPAGD